MTRKDKAPVSLRIRLKYPDVETFVEKYAPNISRGGMFIQSRAPQPVGTQLRFELLIQGGVRLLKGEGRVVWIKEYDASKPMQAHGMGVRFNELDDESRATVERILAFKQRSTSEPPKIPRVRRSQTLEVRGLASLVAATEDAEEPQEARLSAEHPAVQALLAGDAAEPAAQPRQAAGAAQRSAPAPASQPDAKPSSAASVASLSARAGEMAPSNGVA
ncbi:MAG: TIGR02266 family protein, partial [Myxococcales bacterium]|nr:TIGR02266 family protein [Myxococcales bacterium]